VTGPTSQSTHELEVELVLEAIFRRYHYDFRRYARPSISRRLERAQQHFGCSSLTMLQNKILHDPTAFPVLLNFLTVQVSEMFRDPSFFRALRERVIPHLRTYPSLKVWVAGCAEGEELYSLAILFREEGLEARTIFYATELSPTALDKAQAGIYDIDRLALFTENHQKSGGRSSLSDYYIAGYGSAIFDKTLRARTVFSAHSLVSDAVFSEIHLVLCRNVLIYFERDLQDRAIGLFRDSLVHGGFLGLGSKETLHFSCHREHFADFVPSERIFRKRSTSQACPERTHAAA